MQHILNGGNLTLVIHVLDVTYFGITIFHSSSERQGLFVDFNRPGIAHYPTLLNKKRTRITVDNDLPVVKIEIRELNRSDGGTYRITGLHLLNRTLCYVVYILGIISTFYYVIILEA